MWTCRRVIEKAGPKRDGSAFKENQEKHSQAHPTREERKRAQGKWGLSYSPQDKGEERNS